MGILKNKLAILEQKFFIDKESGKDYVYYDINENPASLKLLYSSLFLDAQTCFFMEIFNFFQTLKTKDEMGNNYVFQSISQSCVTYVLKILSRQGIVKIISSEKGYKENLGNYIQVIDASYKNTNPYYTQLYVLQFQKLRDFHKSDIDLILQLANLLNVDLECLSLYWEEAIMFFRIKNSLIYEKIWDGEFFHNLCVQRRIFSELVGFLKYGDPIDENGKLVLKK